MLGEYERPLQAYVLALVGNWADADDIVQETRIRLWEQFHTFRAGSDFGAWTRSIAYFLALSHRERTTRERHRFNPAFYESVSKEFATAPNEVSLRQQALVECLSKLDQTRRWLIEQYYSGGQTMQELAKNLGKSYDGIRKAVYRTRLALSECIDARIRKERGQS